MHSLHIIDRSSHVFVRIVKFLPICFLSEKKKFQLTVQMFTQQVLCNLFFPLVTVREKLLLIVKKFLMSLRSEFIVWTLHNCINRTSFLALFFVHKEKRTRQAAKSASARKESDSLQQAKTYVATVDAFRHINIITSGTTSSIFSLLRVNRNGLCTIVIDT